MKLTPLLAAAALAATGTIALAESHGGDPVAARQDTMKTMGAQLKILTPMAKGETDFDAAAAQAAFSVIAEKSNEIPALFEEEAQDAESEASDDIWANWDDFVTKSEALHEAAMGAAESVTSMETLGAAMGAVGGSCGGCHKPYKL